jgi:hypothetical protein
MNQKNALGFPLTRVSVQAELWWWRGSNLRHRPYELSTVRFALSREFVAGRFFGVSKA